MSTKPAVLFSTTSLRDGLPPATRATFVCGVASPRVQGSLATELQSGGGRTADCVETPGDLGDSPPAAPPRPLSQDFQAFPGSSQEKATIHRRPLPPSSPHRPTLLSLQPGLCEPGLAQGVLQGGLSSSCPGARPQCPQCRADEFLPEGPQGAEHSHPWLSRAGCKVRMVCSTGMLS